MAKWVRWLLPLVPLAFCACEGIEFDMVQLQGSGKIATEERPVSGFNAVVLTGTGDLRIEVGTHESLKIEADDNVLPKIRSDIENGKLKIGLERGFSVHTRTPIRYWLTVKELKEVGLSGSGTVSTAALQADAMDVHLSGSGEIRFDQLTGNRVVSRISGSGYILIPGKVDSQDVHISGSGDYKAEDLQSRTASVSISGSGDSKLWVTEALSASIAGSGDVEYYGEPKITKSVAGSGELIPRGPR
jgi:hypothetical protein